MNDIAVDIQSERILGIATIQKARCESELLRPVSPDASKEEIVSATCSCVNHLCGCQ